MSIEHRVESEKRRVRIVVSGRFGLDEILDAVDAIVSDPAFEPGYTLLSDHTDIDEPITSEQLEAMVAHLGKFTQKLAGTRWAIVTRSPASYGMMRMLSVLGQRASLTIEVFSSFERAEHWLEAQLGLESQSVSLPGGEADAGADEDGPPGVPGEGKSER